MELSTSDIPKSVWKTGRDTIEVLPPSNLKIQTTGDAGVVIVNAGPPHGKKWAVSIRVEITETDA